MTNTSVEVYVKSAGWPVCGNQTLAEVVQRNIEQVGMPDWTEAEQDFARDLQGKGGVEVEGLKTAVTPLTGPSKQRSEEHTSELQSLMCISYAVFCLKKKKKTDHIK